MTRTLAALALLALGSVAHAADTTPFYRMGEPNVMPATTTPTQYQITQPPGATAYRFVNPCTVDIRIKSIPDPSQSVTATTGTRFLSRTVEVISSSPLITNPRLVSIMTVSDPGPAGCAPELTYGTGQ